VQKETKKEEMLELHSQKASVFFVWKNLVFLFFSFFTIELSIYYTSSAASRKACIHLAASSALLVPNCHMHIPSVSMLSVSIPPAAQHPLAVVPHQNENGIRSRISLQKKSW
jgi:hypothetical protein